MIARTQKPASARLHYLDALRIFALFCVLINHTNYLIDCDVLTAPHRMLSFASVYFSKVAVPLFLMISGCTLLRKQDSMKKCLMRFMRIIMVILLFSLITEIAHVLCGVKESFHLKQFLITIYERHITGAYWYLYTYAGLLLTVPFLQKLVTVLKESDFVFYFAVSIFFLGTWTLIADYTPISYYNHYFDLSFFHTNICYLLLGYYFSSRPIKSRKELFGCIIALVLAVAFLAVRTEMNYQEANGGFYAFLDNIALLPVIICTVCVFRFFQLIHFSEKAGIWVSCIGSAVFAAYLISDLLLEVLIPLYQPLHSTAFPFLSVTLFQLLALACCLLVGLLLKHLPLLNRLL